MILNRRLGPYIKLKRLATGGMAELFLAMKAGPGTFEKLVVIKCIIPQYNDHPDYVSLFYDEGSIAGLFNHPNVIHTFDMDCATQGTHYMVMEYMFGRTVTEIIERGEERGKTIPIELAVKTVMDVCEGLYYVHTLTDNSKRKRPLRIVHRDISPQNIFVTFEGQTKVFDFGIAQIQREDGKERQQGVLAGKYAYMSPEQCRGEELDARSDVFSLGIVLYELVTGVRLFKRDNQIRTLRAISEDVIPPPSTHINRFPRYLERIIMKALSRDLEGRYQDALEMGEDLRKYLKISGAKPSIQLTSTYVRRLFADEILSFESFIDEARVQIEADHGRPKPLELSGLFRDPTQLSMLTPAPQLPPLPADASSPVPIAVIEPLFRPAEVAVEVPEVSEPAGATLEGQVRRARQLAVVLAFLVCASTALAVYLVLNVSEPPPPTSSPPGVQGPETTPREAQQHLTLDVRSSPEGAAVLLNGEPTDKKTPTTIDGLSTESAYEVSLVLEGYEGMTQLIEPTEGTLVLHARLTEVVKPPPSVDPMPVEPPPSVDPGAVEPPPSVDPGAVEPIVDPPTPEPAATGRVEVTSKPDGATIWLDGARLDRETPAEIPFALDGATHYVWVGAKGRLTSVEAIVVNEEGVAAPISLKLKRERSSRLGELSVRSQPSGALVTVEGMAVGLTPVEGLKVNNSDRFSLEVSAQGYEVFSSTFEPKKKDVSVFMQLTPKGGGEAPAVLSLDSEPRTEVLLNGASVGTTPIRHVSLSPGEHELEFERSGSGLFYQKVLVLEAGHREALEVKIPKNTLKVASAPAGAEVFINGRRRGSTPFEEEVYVGSHRVEVRPEGGTPERRVVEVSEETAGEVFVSF